MAVADSEYRFTSMDIGGYGKDCDSCIFKHTSFYKSLNENKLPLPNPKPLPASEPPNVPYIILGDEAFDPHTNLMRPIGGKQLSIAKRVFNYRVSRARRYVECAFGILNNKWRIFHRSLNVSPGACCEYHQSMLRST